MGLETMLVVASSGMQVASQLSAGISQKRSADTQAALTLREGEQAKVRAQNEQDAALNEGARAMGEAQASAGAFGFDMSGSASDIIARLAAERSQVARTAIFEGDMAAQNASIEAAQLRKSGKAAMTSAIISSVGSVLGGAAQIKENKANAAKIGAQKPPQYKGQDVPTLPKISTGSTIGSRIKTFGTSFKKSGVSLLEKVKKGI